MNDTTDNIKASDTSTDLYGAVSAETKKNIDSFLEHFTFTDSVSKEPPSAERVAAQAEDRKKPFKLKSVSLKRVVDSLVYAYLIATVITFLQYIYGFFIAAISIDLDSVAPNTWTIFLFAGGVLLTYFSALSPRWDVHRRKITLLVSCFINMSLCILQVAYAINYIIIVPLITKIPPIRWVSKEELYFLFMQYTIVPPLLFTVFIVQAVISVVLERDVLDDILNYQVLNTFDFKPYNRHAYDLNYIRKLSTGGRFLMHEADRFLHWMVFGGSGTGKSSRIAHNILCQDLNTRRRNEDAQIKEVLKMLTATPPRAYISSRMKDGFFDINCVTALPGYEGELDAIKAKYPLCGITILVPDSSLTDVASNLTDARHFRYNRVDPMSSITNPLEMKKNFMGFNPLYISPLVQGEERIEAMFKVSTLLAENFEKLYALRGKGDPYFTSLNRSVTVAFSLCLCVTFPLINHRQPNPGDVEYMVSSFPRIVPYHAKLKEVNNAREDKIFRFVVDFISTDILGTGGSQMFDQSRGLRILMHEFIAMPRVKKIVCVDDEHTIDLDRMLKRGELTYVNFAQVLGTQDSTGLGLFLMLSFIDAVLRRPDDITSKALKRPLELPHFFMMDEMSVALHPQLEVAVSQFRKYRCAIVGLMQSLTQFEKNEITRYMKDVLLEGSGHHILFGRVGASTMKAYEDLGGTVLREKEMRSSSESSITTDNPTYNYSTRDEIAEESRTSGTRLRYHKEGVFEIYSVKNNSILTPFEAYAEYIKKKEFSKQKAYDVDHGIDWDQMYEMYGAGRETMPADAVAAADEILAASEEDAGPNFFVSTGSIIDAGSAGIESAFVPSSDDPSEEAADTTAVSSENTSDPGGTMFF